MNVNAKYVMGSIVGLTLLLGGSFASPASAKVRSADAGIMETRQAEMSSTQFNNFVAFLNQRVTNNRQPDLWGNPGTIISADPALSNFRLDIQNPSPTHANIQVQAGNKTYATVLIPRTLQQFSGNPTRARQQQSELMNAVRHSLWLSGKTTVRVRGFLPTPRKSQLTGNYSN
jgi:hypothetical protein